MRELNLSNKIKKIKVLLLDVDGVLTPGHVYIGHDGNEMQIFSVYDGYGIKLWKRAGFKVGFVSGRKSGAVESRAKKLGIDFLYLDTSDKLAVCEELSKKEGIKIENIAFMGDDLQDLSILRKAGFAIAVSNAMPEVKKAAHYITRKSGGSGAVREAIEHMLKNKGLWDKFVKDKRLLS